MTEPTVAELELKTPTENMLEFCLELKNLMKKHQVQIDVQTEGVLFGCHQIDYQRINRLNVTLGESVNGECVTDTCVLSSEFEKKNNKIDFAINETFLTNFLSENSLSNDFRK